ncbi:Transketolase chloroplastic [Bienertia sinuspersici]
MTKILHTQIFNSPLFQISLTKSQSHLPIKPPSTILSPIRSTKINGQSSNDNESFQSPSSITPPDTVEIKFRRGSRRRRKQQQGDDSSDESMMKMGDKVPIKKNWEEMSMSEKAIELYMGEKGFLFWVNKFAYASIFIIIGGWILFRFVGPSLNLYQLDTPPLSPESVFKGS